MIGFRECKICNEPFETVRTKGRPAEICGRTCHLESGRRRSARWRQRLFEARQQVAAMAQAA